MTAAQTPDAGIDMWAVLLIAERPVYYGPFEEYDVAERFARFVTEEIDPARIVPLKAASIDPLGGWRSPLIEFLNWRDRILEVTP
ncbi:hypothetical protein [Actinomadura sp. GTD37]|uniref:hypothetical protein n=1 Tax=Actinomadura sp. GTD37 TaxID=1778030 RepID=UPI0035C02303